MRRRGFTLIELLVVISVIAVLIGILLPALSRSRQIGRSAACLANMHSLCQAVQMYADNNEGRLPSVGLAHGGAMNEADAWMTVAAREIGSQQVTRCPADESPYWTRPLEGTTNLRQLSFASNYYLEGRVANREEFNVLSRIKRPCTTIFWTELVETGTFAIADHVHPETWFSNPRTLAAREVQIERHLKRANYGFVDGHAESLPFEQTFATAPGSRPTNVKWQRNYYDPTLAW